MEKKQRPWIAPSPVDLMARGKRRATRRLYRGSEVNLLRNFISQLHLALSLVVALRIGLMANSSLGFTQVHAAARGSRLAWRAPWIAAVGTWRWR